MKNAFKSIGSRFMPTCLLSVLLLICLSACGSHPLLEGGEAQGTLEDIKTGSADYLVALEDEPDTVDFQCTTIHYTIALNCFERLVEMEDQEDGSVEIVPSLAESWEISGDRRTYHFVLREGVQFSNGSPLTSSDVQYTFTRLLTHPDSANEVIAKIIAGASQLMDGTADMLEGFQILDDRNFTITLEQPFEAFLPSLAMPGASILDEETVIEARSRFGLDPDCTSGTGPMVLTEWVPGEYMMLERNPHWWAGPTPLERIKLIFVKDAQAVRLLFENGELDILDLDELDSSAEFFMHGDIYQDHLYGFQQLGISYIALNELVKPLDDVRVRQALQYALNRDVLLDAVYSGRGRVEHGIFPYGLRGFNPDLPPIPYDTFKARQLLIEAGYPGGFDIEITVKASSTQVENTLVTMAAAMWEEIGVHATVELLDDNSFMTMRKSGSIACYTATWIADYDDPDNFIGTFFGSRKNTTGRSLCYPRDEIIARVDAARAIPVWEDRLREYQDLEKIIIQEDAAWIPLFSRQRFYVISDRVDGFRASWNGSVKNNYWRMSIHDAAL